MYIYIYIYTYVQYRYMYIFIPLFRTLPTSALRLMILGLRCKTPHPPPNPLPRPSVPSPPVRCAFPHCCRSSRHKAQAHLFSFPARVQTRVSEPAFHFNCLFASSLSSAIQSFLPPPTPSLLLFVSHPIPSIFPYDGELQ